MLGSRLRDLSRVQVQDTDPRLNCTGADEESEDEDADEGSSESVNILFAGGSPLTSTAEGFLPSLQGALFCRVSMRRRLANWLSI